MKLKITNIYNTENIKNKLSNTKNALLINNIKSSKKLVNKRYKIDYCKNFMENNTCTYGENCQFAHTLKELKLHRSYATKFLEISDSLNYKSSLCTKFNFHGYCQYGLRCNYIHQKTYPINKPIDTAPKQKTYKRLDVFKKIIQKNNTFFNN